MRSSKQKWLINRLGLRGTPAGSLAADVFVVVVRVTRDGRAKQDGKKDECNQALQWILRRDGS